MRAQRGAERKRVERGDDHRNGDGQRELLIEPAGDARDERGGHKHRREDNRDRDDRAGDFLHRLATWRRAATALLDMMLDRFDHDDRVVDHEADGEHEAEKRKRVDRKSEAAEIT